MPDSDKKQYERTLLRWESLHEAEAYSLPADVGKIAILCSYSTNGEVNPDHPIARYVSPDDPVTFRAEALALADGFQGEGRAVEVILEAEATDIRMVLQEPSFSDVVVIGHGNLSSVMVDNIEDPDRLFHYDWASVAKDADHLKLGKFVQRTCAKPKRRLSVPLGLFAVSEHRNVLAPVGHYFAPTDLNHPDNDLIRPVTTKRRLSYDDIKSQFVIDTADAVAVGILVNQLFPAPAPSI